MIFYPRDLERAESGWSRRWGRLLRAPGPLRPAGGSVGSTKSFAPRGKTGQPSKNAAGLRMPVHDTGVCPGSFPRSPITLEDDVGKLIITGVALPAQKLPLASPKVPVTQVWGSFTAARCSWRERHGHPPRRLEGLLPEASLGTEQ